MSPAVRVGAAPGAPVPPAQLFRLDLAQLLAAARLAGGVPLPVAPVGTDDDRLTTRLGAPSNRPLRLVGEAVARAADPGPSGAEAALGARGLVSGGELHPGLAGALRALAAAPVGVVVDLAVTGRERPTRLRAWFGAGPGLAARLATVDGLHHELAWFDPRRWVVEVARAATVAGPADPAPDGLPELLVLPSELLVGSARAHREHRPDLVRAMAVGHPDVRIGGAGKVRAAELDEVVALLAMLAGDCTGRLRLWAGRRDRPRGPAAVAVWLRYTTGWYELRPGRGATSVLRRREPVALGLATLPLVHAAREVA